MYYKYGMVYVHLVYRCDFDLLILYFYFTLNGLNNKMFCLK